MLKQKILSVQGAINRVLENPNCPDAPEILPDVLLMPLTAFDREGGRVGYGRGYYDRAVAGLRAAGRFPPSPASRPDGPARPVRRWPL